MREYRVHYENESKVTESIDMVNADGFEVIRGILLFYENLHGKRYTTSYKQWNRVHERD